MHARDVRAAARASVFYAAGRTDHPALPPYVSTHSISDTVKLSRLGTHTLRVPVHFW